MPCRFGTMAHNLGNVACGGASGNIPKAGRTEQSMRWCKLNLRWIQHPSTAAVERRR